MAYYAITDCPKRDRRLCMAHCRDGHLCRAKCVRGKLRCRKHGGLSTGPRTEAGRRRAIAAGTAALMRYHAEQRALRQFLAEHPQDAAVISRQPKSALDARTLHNSLTEALEAVDRRREVVAPLIGNAGRWGTFRAQQRCRQGARLPSLYGEKQSTTRLHAHA